MPSNASPIEVLRAERERLKQEHAAGLSGRKLVQALTAAMDAAVRAVWSEAVDVPDRIALVALGGYGRAELSPHSDVDLMVLHAARSIAPDVGKRVFYELWDAGFAVGHAIRTVKDCVRLAASNLEAETSFLDARFLDGDEALFDEFRTATLKQTRKHGARFVETLRSATAARHLKEGSASYFLEPNIKEGAGGLRDRATIGWLAAAIETERGLVADPELESATDLLLRVRTQLHYMADRRADLMTLQVQDAVAEGLGYEGNGRPAVDAFLRDLYIAARHIGYTARSALAEIAGETARRPVPVRDVAPGIELSSTGLRIFDRRPITEAPELPMRAFAIAAAEDVPIAIETMLWLRSSTASSGELGWNDATRKAFFQILERGRPGRSALEAMDHAGLLVRYLPDWEAVRCLPQHNVYHRFTVDVHLLTAVLEACRLGGPPPDGPDALAHKVWRDLADQKRVLLACLLHDIGKGRDDDHSILGEEIARRICKQMRVATEIADDVEWLVRHHLLLSDTATRRDTTDENLVVETAAWVGSAERLRMLYIVSVADGRATGPAAWTPWKSTLVAELFNKVLHVLEEGRLVGPDASDLMQLRGTELRAALTRFPPESIEQHLVGMPRAYFLAFPTEALIRHFALMAAPPDGPVNIHVGKTDAAGVYELDIVAPDRPGLFSKVAGGLALNGVNVLAAQIFTRADGAALEVFRVSGAHEDEVDPGRWDRVRADIGAVIAGELSLDERLAQKRELYTRPSKGKREPSRVLVENAVSDFFTVVEVHATDRVGLLYAITDALSDLELDIQSARIATYAEDVVDVFYVRDVVGQKITDPAKIREIERLVLERIGD